jgi:signal transduction histidine kinase
MNSKAVRYRWYILVLIIGALGYAAFNLIDARQKMKILDVRSLSGGPVWYVTSVEFDALRLENILLEFSHNLDDHDGDDVRTAFDILWSRLAQMKRGATHDKLINYDIDLTVYDSLMAALVANESRFTALDEDDKSGAVEIAEIFHQFQDDLRFSSLEVLQATVLDTNGVRSSVLGVAKTILYISLTISSVTILLFVIFALDSVLTRRALAEKEALLQEAYAADIAKSQFISVINHELRTPLTSISASLSLLKRRTLRQTPEQTSRLIEIATLNCTALTKLVNDLLDTERFASGKMGFDFQVIDLSEILNRNIENNQSYANSYGVEISGNGIENDVKITADPARIDQLMANLLSNAVKFSDEGGKVQINLITDTGRAIVAVKDHGRGIPEKDRARIFERFEQVDSSDKRERGGTGLGLNIVKAITEAHQAKLNLESELGKGSTFYVSFPITGSA